MSLPHFTKELHGSKRIIYEKIALSEISAIFFAFGLDQITINMYYLTRNVFMF